MKNREFGIEALKNYDYENCEEFEENFNFDEETGKYYRNLIYRDNNVLVKNIAWNPLCSTPIHGHNSRGCWVLVTRGELLEKVFQRREGRVIQTNERLLGVGEITYNHDAIGFHTVQNLSKTVQAATVHCYHPDYTVTAVMDEEGNIQTLPLTYYGEKGVI